MKCIIIDDEPLAREGMEMNVRELPFLMLSGQFGNALAANDFLLRNEVDLIFLDIQMPGITGLDFLRSLKKKPLVILTTAYPQFALEGFELDVVDYLVKPIRLARFVQAVNKARELYELRKSPAPAQTAEIIYLKADRRYHRVRLEDIRYIQGMKDYVLVFTQKEKLMTAMNVKTIHDQLPAHLFARVSKSHIVNVRFIDSIDQDSIWLEGKEIPLGRTYREEFIERFVKGSLIDRLK
jgi:DNA-binding LytR/AlgR family response regulator